MNEPRDLTKLAKPFPRDFRHVDPSSKAVYVAHDTVTQWLLGIVGPFDFELVQVIRGDVAAIEPDPKASSRRGKEGRAALAGVVVGGVWRLRCEVDDRDTVIEEVGDCEDPHNWPHDGARLKQTASDAIKRCAMRLGLGLHLWAGKDAKGNDLYVLYDLLVANEDRPQRSPAPHRRSRPSASAAATPPVAAGADELAAGGPPPAPPAAGTEEDRLAEEKARAYAAMHGDDEPDGWQP
jgi:hypothetical protein